MGSLLSTGFFAWTGVDQRAMKVAAESDKAMGEVKVKVKLTNIKDVGLAEAGALDASQIRTCEIEGLVDTGAVRSVLPATVVQELGLKPYDRQMAQYANGQREEVDLVDGVRFEIMNRRSSDDALVLGDEVLIGQTLLEKMDLLVDCTRRRLVPAHPEFPINMVK